MVQPSLRDLINIIVLIPSDESLGYSHGVPAGRRWNCTRIRRIAALRGTTTSCSLPIDRLART